MKQKCMVMFSCLLLLLFFPPKVDGVASNAVQSSCEITWENKTHKFEVQKRIYSFKGAKLMLYSNPKGFNYTSWVLFDASAEYHPSTKAWAESVTFQIPMVWNRGGDGITISTAENVGNRTHITSGHASDDPWIWPRINQITQFFVEADSLGVSSTDRCFLNSFNAPATPCPRPWSFCAYTDGERTALREEALSIGTCTPQEVKRPTLTLGWDAGGQPSTGHFSSPGNAGIILTAPVDCRPPAADGWAYFFVEIEKETWEPGAYGFSWQPVKSLMADMGYSEAQKQVAGAVNLGLNENGKYRVRAKNMMRLKIQAEEQNPPMSESTFTDWVTITAGELKKDIAKPAATPQRAQSVTAAAAAGAAGAQTVQSQRPDLVVGEFTLSGGPPDDYTLNWRVENRGTAKAAPAHVDLCCRCLGGRCDCREVIVAGYDIQDDRCMRLGDTIELFPKPGGAAAGGGSRFQLYPVKPPQEGFRYMFTVTVDQDNQVDEGANEGNNQLVSYFPSLGQTLNKPAAAAAQPLAGQQNVPALPSVKPPSAGAVGTLASGVVKPGGATPVQQPSAPAPGAVKSEGAMPAQKPGAVSSTGAVLGGAGCSVNVTSPAANQTCYVKGKCPVTWDTSKIKNYGSVFLHVVQIDAQHPQGWEGGGFPVANNGSYQWVVPENVGPLTGATYQIKVVTPDQKCSGKSKSFNIKDKLMQTPVKKPVMLKK